MSNTIAHRPQVHHDHAALLTLLLVACTVLIAALVIWAVNQPEQGVITTTGSEAASAAVIVPAAVPSPDSPVFRHAMMRVYQSGGPDPKYTAGRLHQVDGTTLDPLSTAPSAATIDRATLPLR